MAKLYWYTTAIATVKPEASLTSFVKSLKDLGVEIVDYNEDNRRVLHRAPLAKLPILLELWEKYASRVSFELKASGKARRVRLSLLRKHFEQAEETPSAVLVLASCSNGYSVFAELKAQRAVMKLCRREALEASVTSIPPSLCEWFYPDTNPLSLVRPAQECISEFYERLVGLAGGREST